MSKLFEQIYRMNRLYFHGTRSSNEFNEITYRSSLSITFYLTPDFEYAVNYALDNTKTGYVYLIKLKDKLNIFNARNAHDADILSDIIYTNRKEAFVEGTDSSIKKIIVRLIKDLGEGDWLDVTREDYLKWFYWDRRELHDRLKNAGYDGYFNYEVNEGVSGPSIGLFIRDDKPLKDMVHFVGKQKVSEKERAFDYSKVEKKN